jgi:hypothetical protein
LLDAEPSDVEPAYFPSLSFFSGEEMLRAARDSLLHFERGAERRSETEKTFTFSGGKEKEPLPELGLKFPSPERALSPAFLILLAI